MQDSFALANIICQTLTKRRYAELPELFSEKPQTFYWKLSDLSVLYPQIFDINALISQHTINNIHDEIAESLPQFKDIYPRPIHVLNIKEKYNIFDKQTNTKRTYEGTNQYFTPIALEYIFRQNASNHKEIEQAFFMYQTMPVSEILSFSKDLKYENLRDQVSACSKALVGITNRAHDTHSAPAIQEVWSSFWRGLYDISPLQNQTSQIKNQSSLNFMPYNMLNCVHNAIQEIIINFSHKMAFSLQELKDAAYIKGMLLRKEMIKYGLAPEKRLSETNYYNLVIRIRNEREKFRAQNYMNGLNQR